MTEFAAGQKHGQQAALSELKARIESDLRISSTLYKDKHGLQKALLIIERMERNLR